MFDQVTIAPNWPAPDTVAQTHPAVRPGVIALERIALPGVLMLVFVGYLFRLSSVVVSDMDEGTYLYAGKLVSDGLIPYRDFLLAHPPLVAVLGAAWANLFGADVMPARLAYSVLILTSTVPLYVLTRSIGRSQLMGLIAVTGYTSGMLLLADMGRTIRLEPLMNAFLIAGFAGYFLRPDSARTRLLVGVCCGLATLVKLVAVLPVLFLLVGDLAFAWSGIRSVRLWLFAALGAGLILLPSSGWLLSQPHFIEDVLRSQLDRPGLPLAWRASALLQDFARDPMIPVGLVASGWLLIARRRRELSILALVSLGATVALVCAFRTFYGYYEVQVLPWIAVVFATSVTPLVRRLSGRWSTPLLVGGVLLLAGGIPVAYGEVYYRTAHDHVDSPARVVSNLRQGQGPIYSMYPSFALQSGRPLTQWYYSADSLVARLSGRIGDADFVEVFSRSQALVLWPDELAEYPAARHYVRDHFQLIHQDAYYALWTREPSQ